METGITILGFAVTSIIFVLIIIQLRHLFLSDNTINDEIAKHYEKNGLLVDYVAKLNITEKMKYGVPIIPIFRFYSYYFGFFTGKIDYIRKVCVTDQMNNEQTKYVELTVQGKEIISFNEFAAYDL